MNSRTALIALATLASAAVLAQAPTYTVVNLGALNGQSEAFGINDAGNAVGWSFTNQGTRQAVLFSNGMVTPLSTPAGKNSVAFAISTNGRIVGKLDRLAALWTSPQTYQTLGTVGGQESVASGINDNGLVACSSQNGQAYWKAATIQVPNGAMTVLPMLGGLQGAAAACSNGNVVGWSDLANGQTHATLWANGQTLDFGTLGGPASQFLGSSPQGNTCGWSYLAEHQFTPQNRGFIKRAMVNGANRTLRNLGEPYMARPYPVIQGTGYRGFVWRYYDCGVLRSATVCGVDVQANDLTGSGEMVVGNATLYLYPAGTMKRAVAWINGVFYDLTNLVGASKWTLQEAWGINSKGQIVGQGQSPTGGLMAYRLDPPAQSPSGLSFFRMTGWTNSSMTPTYGQTTSSANIPTVVLYVRKADGMVSTSLGGPYTSMALGTWCQTDPAKPNVRIRLTIDERGAPTSPNGVANWNSICNQLQTAYSAFATGADGSTRLIWNGTNVVNIFANFPNDSELQGRWRFSANGTQWLSIRLKLRKGAGF
ncbi:MAG: hypothetical protein JSS66_18135 [Armatimonadetes bacterium]|nr:hypothetical protein [Armatimonadota bacterium]